MISKTEENYLKAIFKISERSQKSASTNSIAHHLGTSAASVTDMVKKLAEKKYVQYERYKGALLTASGRKVATSLIRKHRLWEVFLVKNLRFSWDQVHEIAEELEHIQSEELIMRLDAFLDYPKFDPHGDPIPNADGKFTIRNQSALSDMHKGQQGLLIGVRDHSKEFLKYLSKHNIKLGTHIAVIGHEIFDRSFQVIVNKKDTITLSEAVTQNLLMKKV